MRFRNLAQFIRFKKKYCIPRPMAPGGPEDNDLDWRLFNYLSRYHVSERPRNPPKVTHKPKVPIPPPTRVEVPLL